MNHVSMLLQFAVVFLSVLSATFWLASATGKGIDWPWKPIKNPSPEELPAHQVKWNSAAAGCAAGAALAQGIFFLIEHPVP